MYLFYSRPKTLHLLYNNTFKVSISHYRSHEQHQFSLLLKITEQLPKQILQSVIKEKSVCRRT